MDQIADLRFANRKGIEKPDFDVGVRIKCGDETIISNGSSQCMKHPGAPHLPVHHTSPS